MKGEHSMELVRQSVASIVGSEHGDEEKQKRKIDFNDLKTCQKTVKFKDIARRLILQSSSRTESALEYIIGIAFRNFEGKSREDLVKVFQWLKKILPIIHPDYRGQVTNRALRRTSPTQEINPEWWLKFN